MGPQGNGASIVEKAVLAVADQRQAACRKLSPDLVCPTGLQVDGHQGQRTAPAENLIGKNGFLNPLPRLQRHVRFALCLISPQQIPKTPRFFRRTAVNHSQVRLPEALFANLPGDGQLPPGFWPKP